MQFMYLNMLSVYITILCFQFYNLACMHVSQLYFCQVFKDRCITDKTSSWIWTFIQMCNIYYTTLLIWFFCGIIIYPHLPLHFIMNFCFWWRCVKLSSQAISSAIWDKCSTVATCKILFCKPLAQEFIHRIIITQSFTIPSSKQGANKLWRQEAWA